MYGVDGGMPIKVTVWPSSSFIDGKVKVFNYKKVVVIEVEVGGEEK
jgi:hypothetical protein